jgi:ABC-type multidrug transport system ATPase subunit
MYAYVLQSSCHIRLSVYHKIVPYPLTSGLDSVSSMSVARALRTVARNGRTVACVVHQPSSKLFSSADDVILMAEGRTLYAGAIEDVPDTLARAGYRCPQYYNMADYCKYSAKYAPLVYLFQLTRT